MDYGHCGVMLNNLERDRLAAFAVAVREGFRVVHTNALAESWLSGTRREQYIEAARASGLTIAAMFIGFDGQSYADISTIAHTVGILPIPELRQHRLDIARQYSDLAAELDVPAVAMHLGFMPRDISHPDYRFLVEAVRSLADHCIRHGQTFHLETGQESADELLHFLGEVDRPNVGVNFDPGNFILYGTDEPLHALEVLGSYVCGVHCKDGRRPTEPGKLGQEVPLGQGEVDFPGLLAGLRQWGYTGPLIIEREYGPHVRAEVQEARRFLGRLLERDEEMRR
jgi:sugar phosphate isomerase/epimerase